MFEIAKSQKYFCGKNIRKPYLLFSLFFSLSLLFPGKRKRKIQSETKKTGNWAEAQLSFSSFPSRPSYFTRNRPTGPLTSWRSPSYDRARRRCDPRASAVARVRASAMPRTPAPLAIKQPAGRTPAPNPSLSLPPLRRRHLSFSRFSPSPSSLPAVSPRESTREHQPHHQPEESVVAMG